MRATDNTETAGDARGVPGRPARPGTPSDYWQRIERIVDAAPPPSPEQRAIIRAAFHQPATKEAAA